MVWNNEGALPNPMRLVSGNTRTHRRPRKAIPNPVTMVTKIQEMAQVQVMSQDEGVGDQATCHDRNPVTRGMALGTDPEAAVSDHSDDGEGDPRHIHPPQERRRIGTPSSPYWRMMTDGDEQGGITDGTQRPSTSENS